MWLAQCWVLVSKILQDNVQLHTCLFRCMTSTSPPSLSSVSHKSLSVTQGLTCVLLLLNSTDTTELSIVIAPSSDTVSVYSTVMLVCVAYGDPPPSITWDFEGSIITNETSYRVSSTAYRIMVSKVLGGPGATGVGKRCKPYHGRVR